MSLSVENHTVDLVITEPTRYHCAICSFFFWGTGMKGVDDGVPFVRGPPSAVELIRFDAGAITELELLSTLEA